MKKIYLSLITILSAVQYSHAQWTTSGSNIYNSNAGNVGIGTVTPNYKLSVIGNYIKASGDGNSGISIGSEGSSRPVIGFHVADDSRRFKMELNDVNTGNERVGIFTTAGGAWSETEVFSINKIGNVGIGTISPTNKLDVQGGNASVYNNGSATNINIGSGISGKSLLQLSTSADAGGYGIIQAVSAQGSAWGNVVINSYGGNVLIGKTSQANTGYILDVAGNVRANQVVINTTGADFVFAPNYRLNSLANVKKYIDKNHHLPEIASAKEMQTNGLNVGENQTRLLQKVEELTLYLIEQQKEMNELRKQVKRLQNHSNKK